MNKPKRMFKLLILVLFAVYALGFGQTAVEQADPVEEDFVIAHGPYLQNPGPDSMTIIWFTNRKAVSEVEFAAGDNFDTFPQWGGLLQKARRSRHGLFDAYTTCHEITLTGLEPGSTYRYRLVSKEMLQFEPYEVIYGPTVVSDIYSFKTLDPSKTGAAFLVFQDVHGNVERLTGLWEKAGRQSVDMVFFNGDSLNHINREEDIFSGILDTAVSLFAREVPFILVRGNHETRGRLARDLVNYFPPRGNRYYYSFRHGPAYFLVMDTGEDKEDSAPVYAGLVDFDRYREEQKGWLEQEILRPEFKAARFRIAVFHIPPFARGHGVDEVTRLWVPVLNEGNVDLVICGHIHMRMRKDPEPGVNDFTVVTAPPSASMRIEVTEKDLTLIMKSFAGEIMEEIKLTSKQ